jgi:hypothetical protein
MKKNDRSFWVAVLVGFVLLAAGDLVIHQIWLGETYKQLQHFWRPEAEMKSRAWIPFLSEFALAFLLATIYPIGYKGKDAMSEGLRFGILMGLLLYLPSILMKSYVYPYPNYLLGNWFLGGMIEVTAAGVGIAFAYQKGK